MFANASTILQEDWRNGQSVNFQTPNNLDIESLTSANHELATSSGALYKSNSNQIRLLFSQTVTTVTNLTGRTIAKGTKLFLAISIPIDLPDRSVNQVLQASNYANIDAALADLDKNIYTNGAMGQINLDAAKYELKASAKKLQTVQIVGVTFTTAYTSVASVTGSTSGFTVTLNMSAVNIAVGDHIGLNPNGTGTNPYILAGAYKVTARTASTVTFILSSILAKAVAPSGACAGSVKIYKSVVELTPTLNTVFNLYFKDVVILPSQNFFVSDGSLLVNDGGLFYEGKTYNIFISRGGKFYADNAYFGRVVLSATYGAVVHIDACMFGNFNLDLAALTVAEASQCSAWQCIFAGFNTVCYTYSGAYTSLYGSIIAHCLFAEKARLSSTIDSFGNIYVSVTNPSTPPIDTVGNGNSYINTLIDIEVL